jgi:hypothetical protein
MIAAAAEGSKSSCCVGALLAAPCIVQRCLLRPPGRGKPWPGLRLAFMSPRRYVKADNVLLRVNDLAGVRSSCPGRFVRCDRTAGSIDSHTYLPGRY